MCIKYIHRLCSSEFKWGRGLGVTSPGELGVELNRGMGDLWQIFDTNLIEVFVSWDSCWTVLLEQEKFGLFSSRMEPFCICLSNIRMKVVACFHQQHPVPQERGERERERGRDGKRKKPGWGRPTRFRLSSYISEHKRRSHARSRTRWLCFSSLPSQRSYYIIIIY